MPVKQNEYITKTDLKDFGDGLSKMIVDDLSDVIAALAQNMHDELGGIKKDIGDIRRSLDRLTNTIDGFVKRLDDTETDNVSRDLQYKRLLKWAEKVSTKTGIPIEY